MIKHFLRTAFLLCATFHFNSFAHIDKTSLSIKGGEMFKAGEKVQLTWKYAIFHNRMHYIYFSAGTGKPWLKIDSVMEKSGTANLSYTWTVPQTATESARIRIFQSFIATPGERTNDYTIVSNTFSILAATKTLKPVASDHKNSNKPTNNHLQKRYDLSGRFVKEYDAAFAERIKLMRKTVFY